MSGEATRASLCAFDKTVSDAADGIEIFCGEAELLAQAAHVGVHGAGVDEIVVFPNVAKQLLAGLDAAAALREDGEQFEFGGGEFHGFAAPTDDVPRAVD